MNKSTKPFAAVVDDGQTIVSADLIRKINFGRDGAHDIFPALVQLWALARTYPFTDASKATIDEAAFTAFQRVRDCASYVEDIGENVIARLGDEDDDAAEAERHDA
jgi:hypothetical protein